MASSNDPPNKRSTRQRFLSVGQAGVALSLATAAALGVGVMVVGGLGGGRSDAPLEIRDDARPATPRPEAPYVILQQDDPTTGGPFEDAFGVEPNDRSRWARSFTPAEAEQR